MFDYVQRPPTKEWDKNYSKIFKLGIVNIQKPEDCHYSQRGKYICICKSNICKKDIQRR